VEAVREDAVVVTFEPIFVGEPGTVAEDRVPDTLLVFRE
jgi:hypothetical protein